MRRYIYIAVFVLGLLSLPGRGLAESGSLNKISLSAEFGFGNIITLNALFNTGYFKVGVAGGFSSYRDEDYESTIQILEPSLVLSKQFSSFVIRLRTGIDYLTDSKFNMIGRIPYFSPDFISTGKNLYAGIGFPMVFGSEGFGFAPALGVGYCINF